MCPFLAGGNFTPVCKSITKQLVSHVKLHWEYRRLCLPSKRSKYCYYVKICLSTGMIDALSNDNIFYFWNHYPKSDKRPLCPDGPSSAISNFSLLKKPKLQQSNHFGIFNHLTES